MTTTEGEKGDRPAMSPFVTVVIPAYNAAGTIRRALDSVYAQDYGALEIVSQKMADVDPIDVFKQAVENVKPSIEVRSKRVGGATYQVPTPVNYRRQQTLAVRWILQAIRGKKGRPTHISLAEELMHAYRREGTAMTTRDNVHRMADANKAFAHFAW